MIGRKVAASVGAAFRALCVLSITTLAFASPPAAGTPCAKLTQLNIPQLVVKMATDVTAGSFTPPGSPRPLTVPAFCRVEIEAHPTADSDIKLEVWIPAEKWNGKFEGVGNGGYSGSVSYPAMATALGLGYATASTDTGHEGGELEFGVGHPEKVTDWAFRAIHVTAEIAKLVIRNNAGRFPERSYFNGCSTGGHQALSEAQRYPGDYDGIVAGDPAYDRVHQTAAYLWSWMATHDEHGGKLLSDAQLHLVTKSAVAACDALDGVKDGVIDDPRRCHFDPAVLACKGDANGSCLMQPQIDALKKVYAGLKNPRTGEQIFPGWSYGTEGFGDAASAGWRAYIIDPPQPMRIEVFKYFLFNDPNWDWRTFDFDKDMAYADAKVGFMSAVNTDLRAFQARGGKLLMYTGWADPVAAPMDIIKYYEGAVRTMGGLGKTQQFFRFFMAPGMGHCGGGPGPNSFDAMSTLDGWVENGLAPARMIATHSTAGKPDRTRPLCPYPQAAKWTGKGSTDDADNFVCLANSGVASVGGTAATRSR
jgi:feruloyl esterase